jgi:hypothetical protein
MNGVVRRSQSTVSGVVGILVEWMGTVVGSLSTALGHPAGDKYEKWYYDKPGTRSCGVANHWLVVRLEQIHFSMIPCGTRMSEV